MKDPFSFQDAIEEYRKREGDKGLIAYPKPLPMPDFDILPHKALAGPIGVPLDSDVLSIFRTMWFMYPCLSGEGMVYNIELPRYGILMGCALFTRKAENNRPIWAIEHVRAMVNSTSILYDAPALVMPRYRRILLAWDGRDTRIGLDMRRIVRLSLDVRVNRPCYLWIGSFVWDAPH